ncbi:MAG TPA: hypothetical protein VIM31_01485 [Candidatus Microsaccharimonas sp.]|jgi:hypothetical protein
MSYIGDESNDKWLFSELPEQPSGPLYYREKPHFRTFLRKIITPIALLVLPIVLVICFQNIARIIGQWIDTSPSYVTQRLDIARSRFNDWSSHFNDLSWIGTVVVVVWVLVIVYLFIKAYYDWNHTFHSISQDYVIEAQKRLLQEERSMTIEAHIVVGASVRRTLIDKFFPVCGSVIVQTIDLEGEGKKILFQDVKDPYRMRDVILKVKQSKPLER